MKKNTQLIICSVAALAIGYLGGAMVGIPGVPSQSLSGDIGKVNKYNKQVSEDVKAFQERLQNDEDFCAQTVATMAIISNRVQEYKALVDATADVTKNIPELEDAVAYLASSSELADNADIQAKNALLELGNLATGESTEGVNFEQLAQNATISYLVIDKQAAAAKEFVEAADLFITANPNLENGQELSLIRDLWANFCTTSAILNNDKAEAAYWGSKKNLVSQENLGLLTKGLSNKMNISESVFKFSEAMCALNKADNLGRAKKGSFDLSLKDNLGAMQKDNNLGAKQKELLNNAVYFPLANSCPEGLAQNVMNNFSKGDALGIRRRVIIGFNQSVLGLNQNVLGLAQSALNNSESDLAPSRGRIRGQQQ